MIMTEYIDDELPLPKFAEVFGDGTNLVNKKIKRPDLSDGGGEETTGYFKLLHDSIECKYVGSNCCHSLCGILPFDPILLFVI